MYCNIIIFCINFVSKIDVIMALVGGVRIKDKRGFAQLAVGSAQCNITIIYELRNLFVYVLKSCLIVIFGIVTQQLAKS